MTATPAHAAMLAPAAVAEAKRLLAEGKAEAALDTCRDILKTTPDNTEAMGTAAEACAALGLLSEAENYYRRMLALHPDANTYTRLGKILLKLRQGEKALECLTKALRMDARHLPALTGAAEIVMLAKKPEQAEKFYRQALAIDPACEAALLGMGSLCSVKGHDIEALKYYKAVLTRSPNHAQALFLVGNTLNMGGNVEEAQKYLKQALAADANHANAHAVLASSYQKMFQLEKAQEHAEKGYALDPENSEVLRVLGYGERSSGNLEKSKAYLEKALAKEHTPIARLQLYQELGLTLDKMKRYDEAFAAFAEMQRLRTTCERAKRHNGEEYLRLIKHFHENFTAGQFDAVKEWKIEDDLTAPWFVVGFPRSGTTLLQQMLATHPDVFARDENTIIGGMLTKTPYFQRYDGQYIRAILEITPQDTRALRAWYFAQLDKHYGDACKGKRYLDKVPYNLVMLPLIAKLFPETKVICLLRDPRDCCLSSFMQRFNFSDASMNFATLESTINFYAAMMALWPHYREILPLPMRTQRYEDLVAEPEAQLREISDFLGLTWNAAMLEYHKDENRAISTPNAEGIKTPVHTKALGKWKPYEKYLAPHMPQLLPPMREFGYEA